MGSPHEGSIRRPIAPWANALTTELHLAAPSTGKTQHNIRAQKNTQKMTNKQNTIKNENKINPQPSKKPNQNPHPSKQQITQHM